MSKIKTPEELLKQEWEDIPHPESCFAQCKPLSHCKEDELFSKEQMTTFANFYHEYAMEQKILVLEKFIRKNTKNAHQKSLNTGLEIAIEILRRNEQKNWI